MGPFFGTPCNSVTKLQVGQFKNEAFIDFSGSGKNDFFLGGRHPVLSLFLGIPFYEDFSYPPVQFRKPQRFPMYQAIH